MKRTTIVIILLAVFVVGCLTLAACSHTHEFGEWTVTKQPTCTQDGLKEKVCKCGEKETEIIAATGHTYGEWKEVKAATCTKTGLKESVCKCGEKKTEVIVATGHSYDSWVVTRQPTCTEDGIAVGFCECGDQTSKVVPKNGHDYKSVVTEPTCTEEGYTTYTCSRCGRDYVDDFVGKVRHNITKYSAKPATCTEFGWNSYETCINCDYTTYTEIPATGHSYENNTCLYCGVKEPVASIGLEYTLSEDGYIVSGPGTCTDTDIVIPSTYDGKPVVGIGESAFWFCYSLTSVTILEGVTSIGKWAFYECENLTSITLPGSLKSIGNISFNSCISLKNITIPEGVTSIGGRAFCNCDSLTSIVIPSSVTSIGEEAFWMCYLTSVTFVNPNGWYVKHPSSLIGGFSITLTNASYNAEILTSTYGDYYWYKIN